MEKYNWEYLCNGATFFHLDLKKFAELANFFHSIDCKIFASLVQRALTDDIESEISQKFAPDDCNRLRLLLLIANFEYMINLYQSKNYPKKLLDEISHDLALWMPKAELDYGYWGMRARLFFWTKWIMTGEVKQFGRLQCNDIYHFEPKRTFTVGKNSISHGDPCINLHIPATGPLDIAQCIDSLRAMVDFSAKFNPDFDYKAVVCCSWLLDSQFKNLLPPDSNIIKFQNLGHNFPLPEIDQDEEVIWRLWNLKMIGVPLSDLPCETSLQKNVVDFFLNDGHFHEGCLIIFRDELNKLLSAN